MTWELVSSIIGLLTAVAVLMRWLIAVYWKQAETIEDLRHKNEKRTIISMKDAIDDLKKEMNMHKAALKTYQDEMIHLRRRLEKSADEFDTHLKSMNDTIAQVVSKISVMESQVISLAKGMLMIKNKVQGNTGDGH